MIKPSGVLSVLFAMLVLGCAQRTHLTIERSYYNDLQQADTSTIYDTFRRELSSPIGHHVVTNAHILLGKRGIEAARLVEERHITRSNAFYFDRFFQNLAFYSRINVCDIRHDLISSLSDSLGQGVYFQCSTYRTSLSQSGAEPFGPYQPRFRTPS